MKTKYLITLGATLALSGALGFSATLSGAGLDGQSGQTAMPGPVHKQLAKRAGEYTTVTKFSVAPGAPATESTGTAKMTVILNGRFLIEEDAGLFLGQQTKGTRIWGYDNSTKQSTSQPGCIPGRPAL